MPGALKNCSADVPSWPCMMACALLAPSIPWLSSALHSTSSACQSSMPYVAIVVHKASPLSGVKGKFAIPHACECVQARQQCHLGNSVAVAFSACGMHAGSHAMPSPHEAPEMWRILHILSEEVEVEECVFGAIKPSPSGVCYRWCSSPL